MFLLNKVLLTINIFVVLFLDTFCWTPEFIILISEWFTDNICQNSISVETESEKLFMNCINVNYGHFFTIIM